MNAMGLFGSFFGKQGVIAARSPDLSRRKIIIGVAASLVAAPAIVRAASLMPVKALPDNIFGFELDINDLLAKCTQRYSFSWTDVRWFDTFGQERCEKINIASITPVGSPH